MPGLTKECDNFESLVQAIREKLGPCSGIDSDDMNASELEQLMSNYISDESEWSKYYFPASNMAYTRNLVDKGNGKSNLVIAPTLTRITPKTDSESSYSSGRQARQALFTSKLIFSHKC